MMYQLQDLLKVYGKQVVLQGLNLKFSKGQFVALMGKNGSGKSTLQRLLAQQENFNDGDILFDGRSLKDPTHNLNAKILFICEEHDLPLEESIEVWSLYFQSHYPDYDLEIFKNLSQKFYLDISKSFSMLSRGQKMKALFALKAAAKPDVYLVDEITSVLDSASRIELMNFLNAEKQRGCLIIISTNISSEMQGFATDICFLGETKVILYCKVADIPKHFTKLRTVHSALKLEEAGARKVRLNSDGTWSFLIKNEKLQNLRADETIADKRGITIEDVASYFSAELF